MVRTGQPDKEALEPLPPKSSISWWWLAPWVLALALIPFVWRPLWKLAGSLTAFEPAAAPTTAPSPLGFTAKREGSDWRLSWSRDSLTRLSALGAMLTISDGGVDRLQFLSPQDLASGAILYVPRTTDLTFNFKVTVPNAPDIEEQVRVLGAESNETPQLAYTLPPRRIGEAARQIPASSAPDGEAAAAPAATPAIRRFQPPASPAKTAAPHVDVALPIVALPSGALPQIPRIDAAAPPPAQPAPAAPRPAEAVRPASLPVVTRTDPSPARTVPAAWPRNVSRSANVEIRIRVQIDPAGRVVGASPLQRNVSNYPFVDSALTAARLWTFTPAKENGKPIPSESVLTFKFTP
jgi:TonB family protein